MIYYYQQFKVEKKNLSTDLTLVLIVSHPHRNYELFNELLIMNALYIF